MIKAELVSLGIAQYIDDYNENAIVTQNSHKSFGGVSYQYFFKNILSYDSFITFAIDNNFLRLNTLMDFLNNENSKLDQQ